MQACQSRAFPQVCRMQAFHPSYQRSGRDDPQLFRLFEEGGAVFRGIVVGQRNDIQPVDNSHAGNVGGSHFVIAAGRETGMYMQIAEIPAHTARISLIRTQSS